jgi:hypothetical protein
MLRRLWDRLKHAIFRLRVRGIVREALSDHKLTACGADYTITKKQIQDGIAFTCDICGDLLVGITLREEDHKPPLRTVKLCDPATCMHTAAPTVDHYV